MAASDGERRHRRDDRRDSSSSPLCARASESPSGGRCRAAGQLSGKTPAERQRELRRTDAPSKCGPGSTTTSADRPPVEHPPQRRPGLRQRERLRHERPDAARRQQLTEQPAAAAPGRRWSCCQAFSRRRSARISTPFSRTRFSGMRGISFDAKPTTTKRPPIAIARSAGSEYGRRRDRSRRRRRAPDERLRALLQVSAPCSRSSRRRRARRHAASFASLDAAAMTRAPSDLREARPPPSRRRPRRRARARSRPAAPPPSCGARRTPSRTSPGTPPPRRSRPPPGTRISIAVDATHLLGERADEDRAAHAVADRASPRRRRRRARIVPAKSLPGVNGGAIDDLVLVPHEQRRRDS